MDVEQQLPEEIIVPEKENAPVLIEVAEPIPQPPQADVGETDTTYPNDIVEAYTQQIDSLSSPADLEEEEVHAPALYPQRLPNAEEEVELEPLDSESLIEPVFDGSRDELTILANKSSASEEEKVEEGKLTKTALVSEKNTAGLSIKIPTHPSTTTSAAADIIDADTLEPLPAVIRERQPAGTPSMEILPFPKSQAIAPAPAPAPLNAGNAPVVKAAPAGGPSLNLCCSLFPCFSK